MTALSIFIVNGDAEFCMSYHSYSSRKSLIEKKDSRLEYDHRNSNNVTQRYYVKVKWKARSQLLNHYEHN